MHSLTYIRLEKSYIKIPYHYGIQKIARKNSMRGHYKITIKYGVRAVYVCFNILLLYKDARRRKSKSTRLPTLE